MQLSRRLTREMSDADPGAQAWIFLGPGLGVAWLCPHLGQAPASRDGYSKTHTLPPPQMPASCLLGPAFFRGDEALMPGEGNTTPHSAHQETLVPSQAEVSLSCCGR